MGNGVCRHRLYLPVLPCSADGHLASGMCDVATRAAALDSEIFVLSGGLSGGVVAVNQNFMGWVKISKGEFAFNENLFIDPFLLSTGSLFIILGQLWLILGKDHALTEKKASEIQAA